MVLLIFLLPDFVSLDIYLLPAVYNYCSFWFFWCLAMHLDIIYKSKCVIKFIHLKKIKWSIFWDEGSIIYLSLKPIDWWYVTNSKLVLLIRTFRREWLSSWSREESLDCGTTLRKHSQFPFFFWTGASKQDWWGNPPADCNNLLWCSLRWYSLHLKN